jgi:glycosyltransferase involved in cell wall biosynthesis
MMNPRVSVVTPSFNQAGFLEQTLLSVLDQDYSPIDLLVIDGGSTDGTIELIKRYEHRLAYWVSEKDKGQADAINKGLKRATGDIVAFLNSDDYYYPGAVSKIVDVFRKQPDVGVVYGQARWITSDDRPLNQTHIAVDGQAMLERFASLPQPAVFLRREVLERIGGLDPTFHWALDSEWFFRAVGNFKAIALPSVLATMRLHDASKSVSAGTGFAPEMLRIAEMIIESPERYPRFQVNARETRAIASIRAARFLYVGGKFDEAARQLLGAARLSRRYRREIILDDVPRLALRALVGRKRYMSLSVFFDRVRT